jgi:hypothetical protein
MDAYRPLGSLAARRWRITKCYNSQLKCLNIQYKKAPDMDENQVKGAAKDALSEGKNAVGAPAVDTSMQLLVCRIRLARPRTNLPAWQTMWPRRCRMWPAELVTQCAARHRRFGAKLGRWERKFIMQAHGQATMWTVRLNSSRCCH